MSTRDVLDSGAQFAESTRGWATSEDVGIATLKTRQILLMLAGDGLRIVQRSLRHGEATARLLICLAVKMRRALAKQQSRSLRSLA